MRPQIKISGIISLEDAKMALQLGADYISLDHISNSKRFLDLGQITTIMSGLNPSQKKKVILANDMQAVNSLLQFTKKVGIRLIEPTTDSLGDADLQKAKKTGLKIFRRIYLSSSADILDINLNKNAFDHTIFDIRPNFISRVDKFTRNYKVAHMLREIFNDVKDNVKAPNYGISGELNLDSIFTLMQACKPDLIDFSIQFEKDHSFYKSNDKMASFFGKLNIVFPKC